MTGLQKLITFAANYADSSTIHHETFHAAWDILFDDEDRFAITSALSPGNTPVWKIAQYFGINRPFVTGRKGFWTIQKRQQLMPTSFGVKESWILKTYLPLKKWIG